MLVDVKSAIMAQVKNLIFAHSFNTLQLFSIGACGLCLKNILNFIFIVYFNKLQIKSKNNENYQK